MFNKPNVMFALYKKKNMHEAVGKFQNQHKRSIDKGHKLKIRTGVIRGIQNESHHDL